MSERSPQCKVILAALRRGEHLSPLDALSRFGCNRLAARIHDLKRDGVPVESRMETGENGKRWKLYWLGMKADERGQGELL